MYPGTIASWLNNARGATCKVYRFIAPGAQGTIFEGTIFQILVQRVQFCQIVPLGYKKKNYDGHILRNRRSSMVDLVQVGC